MAAIPLNTRGHPTPQRLPDGMPLCPKGLLMSPSYPVDHTLFSTRLMDSYISRP